MNVTCTGCPAKYSVPDEKVRGKKVRITCKHCGTNIVVDGSVLDVAGQSAAPLAEPDPEPKPTAAESTWLVGFVDERQEQHTTSEIVSLYAAGGLDDETLVWKDGMDDWLPPFDVPEIAAVLKQRGVVRRAPTLALPSSSDEEATVVGPSPFEEQTVVFNATSEIAASANPALAPAAAVSRQSTPEIKLAAAAIRQSTPEIKPTAAAKPAAARRAEKRPEVDLFGGVADAGSETDDSLDFGMPDEPAHKLTGARNESSVLFSLDALTKPDPKATSQKKTQDKKKEDQATAALFGDSAPNSLMNMGGGGGLAELAAPDFTKPVAAAPDPVRPSDAGEQPNAAPKRKGAGVLIGIVIGVAVAAGVAFVVASKKPPADKPASDGSNASANANATTAAAPTTAPEAASAAPEAASAAPAASEAAPTTSAAAAASAKPVAESSTSPEAAGKAPGTSAVPPNKPAEKPQEAKKTDAPAAPPAVADFNKSAAVAALGTAAANAASCKKPDGPTGAGRASVTFAPSGRATNATVSGALAGTEVGGCVARVFRSARIPPFGGDPVTVTKSFSLE